MADEKKTKKGDAPAGDKAEAAPKKAAAKPKDAAKAAGRPKVDATKATGAKPAGAAKPKAAASGAKAGGADKPKAAGAGAAKPKAAGTPKASADKSAASGAKSGGATPAATPEERARAAQAEQRAARRASGEAGREVRAVAKYLRFGARKGRLVVDQIRGKRIVDAATLLMFSERAAAREIMKVLKSAVANAENNHGMSADELYVQSVFVDEGPTFKRWKPRARGRVDRMEKRTCHVTVVVAEAPAELLEGKRGKGGTTTAPDRAARVAASKAKSTGPRKQDAGARKPAGAKGAERKPAATSDADEQQSQQRAKVAAVAAAEAKAEPATADEGAEPAQESSQ